MVYDCILLISLILLVCVDHSCLKYWPNNRHCTSTKPREDGMEPFLAGVPDANGCLYKQFWLSMRSSICSGDRFCGGPQSSELFSFAVASGLLGVWRFFLDSFCWSLCISLSGVSFLVSMVWGESDLFIILQFLRSTKFLRSFIVLSTFPRLWAAPESDSKREGMRPDSRITSKRWLAISSDELVVNGYVDM